MITIRQAGMSDEERVFDLLHQLMSAVSEDSAINQPSGVEVFREMVGGETGTIMVAEEDGEMLGLVTLSYPVAIRCGGRYSCIEEFIVTERARGKGVGGRLLEAAISKAAGMGCAELQVNRPSELGYPVYLEHGWEDLGKHLSLAPVRSRR